MKQTKRNGMAAVRKKLQSNKRASTREMESYRHPEADLALRPDVGTQAQFRKKKPPVSYRYDSSLSPALDWDERNPAREEGEAAIREILDIDARSIDSAQTVDDAKAAGRTVLGKAKGAATKLGRISRPFLNWAGKAERLSFDVPTLPLFVHERLSTKAIIETLQSHKKVPTQANMFDLFGDPKHPVSDQVLRAYEYRDEWVNRMILGDSLVVMNSLLHYEGLGGQVQMIYIDPPYGVRFGSNFQPFVRKRSVSHNDDDDMSREPEMVKAYRDTWELGLHSYLTYMRDRLLLARELLHLSGSVFVQISDENLHHLRELMDEVFGPDNFSSIIAFTKAAGGLESVSRVGSRLDYLVWYFKDASNAKYVPLFESRDDIAASGFTSIEIPGGDRHPMTADEKTGRAPLPSRARPFMSVLMTKPGPGSKYEIEYQGRIYTAGNRWWGTTKEGLSRVIKANRVLATENSLRFLRYLDDFRYKSLSNLWDGLGGAADPIYVVQTNPEVIKRCILMTSSPGDLILDPTCGSGTSAYVAEQWGRRWITIDTSRVPLALARQRLLTAIYPYYQLKDETRGPIGGFVYSRKQNRNGEEIGGIVPHITLQSIAREEPPAEEILVDRPETDEKIVRVTGRFCVEATIPTPIDWDGDVQDDTGGGVDAQNSYLDRMLEVLRRAPVLQLGGSKAVTLKNVRPPAKSLSLSAEAVAGNGADKPVALVFGPENGPISEKLVFEAAREAHAKSYAQLYVIGFAIQPNARRLVEDSDAAIGIPATYVQATPDLMMGDLLKTMRSSQIFSVCGMPEITLKKIATKKAEEPARYQVELVGLDVFDPVTMNIDHRKGDDVPAWMLDTDYNGLVFHGSQVFFPRTASWDNLKKALRATHEESVWDHLAGTLSAPFEAGEHGQIAVKVIDDRGNELLVVKSVKDNN